MQMFRINRSVAAALLLVLLVSFCEKLPTLPPFDYHEGFVYHAHSRVSSSNCRILFIGNSLTYYNDVPGMVRTLAQVYKKRVFIDEITFPGVQLQEHSSDEYTARKIREQQWDFVILQEAVPEVASPSHHRLIAPYVRTLKQLIHANCPTTRIIYFMPYATTGGSDWGFVHVDYNDTQYSLNVGTLVFAAAESMMVAPVGYAWQTVYNQRKDFSLYANDGSHPSMYGGFLEACVYFATIFQDSLTPIPNEFERWAYIKQVSTSTVLDSLAKWLIRPLEDPARWNIPDSVPPDTLD